MLNQEMILDLEKVFVEVKNLQKKWKKRMKMKMRKKMEMKKQMRMKKKRRRKMKKSNLGFFLFVVILEFFVDSKSFAYSSVVNALL